MNKVLAVNEFNAADLVKNAKLNRLQYLSQIQYYITNVCGH